MAETVQTYTVPAHHVVQFTSNVQMELQKLPVGIRSLATQGNYAGATKAQVVNFIGTIEFVERTTKYADTVLTDTTHKQRWIVGKDYDVGMLVDRLDTLRMIYDPTNPYVKAFSLAYARKQDQIMMDAFFATAKAGEQGVDAVAFPAQDQIVHASTGLTTTKLRSARKLLKKRFVDLRMNRPYIACEAEGIDDLLGETVVGSSDYNAVKPLVDGEVSRYLGFDFFAAEGYFTETDLGGGNIRIDAPVWVTDGMHFGDWQGIVITIGPRPDKNNIKQIHGSFSAGATRVQEGMVIQLQYLK